MEEVGEWLDTLGLEKYKNKFEDEEFDDMAMIKELDSDALAEMFLNIGCRDDDIIKIKNSLSGKTPDPLCVQNSVSSWLQSLNLFKYNDWFMAEDYDDLSILQAMSESERDAMLDQLFKHFKNRNDTDIIEKNLEDSTISIFQYTSFDEWLTALKLPYLQKQLEDQDLNMKYFKAKKNANCKALLDSIKPKIDPDAIARIIKSIDQSNFSPKSSVFSWLEKLKLGDYAEYLAEEEFDNLDDIKAFTGRELDMFLDCVRRKKEPNNADAVKTIQEALDNKSSGKVDIDIDPYANIKVANPYANIVVEDIENDPYQAFRGIVSDINVQQDDLDPYAQYRGEVNAEPEINLDPYSTFCGKMEDGAFVSKNIKFTSTKEWLDSLELPHLFEKLEEEEYDWNLILGLTEDQIEPMTNIIGCNVDEAQKIRKSCEESMGQEIYKEITFHMTKAPTDLMSWLGYLGFMDLLSAFEKKEYEWKKIIDMDLAETVAMITDLKRVEKISVGQEKVIQDSLNEIRNLISEEETDTAQLESRTANKKTKAQQMETQDDATDNTDPVPHQTSSNASTCVKVKVLKQQKDAVCKVEYTDDLGNCGSGFLIEYGGVLGIMSNNHVFNSREQVKNRKAIFRYTKKQKKNKPMFKVDFAPEKGFWTSKKYDVSFCCIKETAKFKKAQLKPVELKKNKPTVQVGDQIHIYQHPDGREKEKASIDVFKVPLLKHFFHYRCDTQGGSSGSPVFCGERIAGVHHASKKIRNEKGKSLVVNEGIKIHVVISEFNKWLKKTKPLTDMKKKEIKKWSNLGVSDGGIAKRLGLNSDLIKAHAEEEEVNPYAAKMVPTSPNNDEEIVEEEINPYASTTFPANEEIKISEDVTDSSSTKKTKKDPPSISELNLQKVAVCKIQFEKSDMCATGFFASIDGRSGIMTNHHVFKNRHSCKEAIMIFRYTKKEKPKRPQFEVKFNPNLFFWTNKELDATFVGCNHKIITEQGIKPVALEDYDVVSPKDQIHIYQHPSGKPKQLARSEIFTTGNPKPYHFGYHADTMPGSSGSPVFCGAKLIGIHHAAKRAISSNGQAKRYNEAIHMETIYAQLVKDLPEYETKIQESGTINVDDLDEDDKELIQEMYAQNKPTKLIADKLSKTEVVISAYINQLKAQSHTDDFEEVKKWLQSFGSDKKYGPVLEKRREYRNLEKIKSFNEDEIQKMFRVCNIKLGSQPKFRKAILRFGPGVTADKFKWNNKHHAYKLIGKMLRDLNDIGGTPGNLSEETWIKYEASLKVHEIELHEGRRTEKEENSILFDQTLHRFPDNLPYRFNSMTNGIGSWMGDCFGMMQWPMPSKNNRRVFQDLITQNNVGLIVALGGQNQDEKPEMSSYWQTLGNECKEEEIDLCKIREVSGIPPNDSSCSIYQFEAWDDYTSPKHHRSAFDSIFQRIQEIETLGQRILIHCRAGLGRSGTLRLMYKSWKGDFEEKDLLKEFVTQRALRAHTVQTFKQFKYIHKYITNQQPESLTEWLKSLELEEFEEQFVEQDYDTIEFVLTLFGDELTTMVDAIGANAAQSDKIKNSLDELTGRKPTAISVEVNPYGSLRTHN